MYAIVQPRPNPITSTVMNYEVGMAISKLVWLKNLNTGQLAQNWLLIGIDNIKQFIILKWARFKTRSIGIN